MRNLFLAMGLIVAGCATTSGNEAKSYSSSASKTLEAGECGLYVWTADALKTFILFVAPSETSYLQNKKMIALTEINPTIPPLAKRTFKDPDGKSLSLTLLSPEDIEGGVRYKSGRLTSLSDEGWEKVVPIVGLYACQPAA